MIKIENTEVVGWEPAIRGMRNPMNSWEKSDSLFFDGDEYHDICGNSGPCSDREEGFDLGLTDEDLMLRLAKGGSVHAKYRRMIAVYADITAPLYWWKEFDTYKVGTVANSCSTMHKIAEKEFTLEDFSCEHLLSAGAAHRTEKGGSLESEPIWQLDYDFYGALLATIKALNGARMRYLAHKNKVFWWQMIQLLPSSYNQRRTVMLNYEVLAGIYPMRKDHKLDEWHDFCRWIESLPHSEIITI